MFWNYVQDDERRGPVDETTLETLIGSGVITADTLVWREGMPQWALASETELKRYFRPSDSPPSSSTSLAYAPPSAPVEAQTFASGTGLIPRREALPVIALSLLTCGIYSLYLLYKWAGEINTVVGREKHNPTLVLLLSLLTCGIAGTVYQILFAFELEKLAAAKGVQSPQSSLGAIVCGLNVGGLVLSLVGIPVSLFTMPAAVWLVQAELNKLADT